MSSLKLEMTLNTATQFANQNQAETEFVPGEK